MSELIITSREDLEKMLRNILNQVVGLYSPIANSEQDDRLNQKQAAAYLGVTQATLIRWKEKGLVPVEQLPGSTKVTYYKSQLKAIIQRNPKLLQAPRK